MTSLHRQVVSAPATPLSTESLWRLFLLSLAAVAFVTVRACGYEFRTVLAYGAYLAVYVVLPGVAVMHGITRGRLSVASVLALAVPTGFAVEILTFLGLSAAGCRHLYVWSPLIWLALVLRTRLKQGRWPVRVGLAGNHAGIAASFGLVFLATAVMAVSQMFVEAPLAGGLPTRAIFHDWVYLISRAAVIKNNWPLDDPSLSGTPLQYHYFMMVHAAAASSTAGVEIASVLLRLVYVPLGMVLAAQAYVLGRAVARTPWGGVLAAGLLVVTSEVSLARSYGEPMFLGLFVRWLFVSPTFFFGMIFCGALLLAVRRSTRLRRCRPGDYAWLLLLGVAGTGAKGTLLPVLVCALMIWALWRWWREHRVPRRIVVLAVIFGFAFLIVYLQTMVSWRTGEARLNPFHVYQLTGFWRQYLTAWAGFLAKLLPPPLALAVAQIACAVVVFAGTCGVRLLAIPYLLWGDLKTRDSQLVGWLGSFFVAATGMGLLLELNSYGELYLILMVRLPMAALAAGFLVAASRRVAVWWRVPAAAANSRSPFVTDPEKVLAGSPPRNRWVPRLVVAGGIVVLLGAFVMQTSLWWARNRPGLVAWFKAPSNPQPDTYMEELREALLWVRKNTERNAVLVANAFTPENMRNDHWGALDHTLMGVHFYYSALSERRLWFEGPHYVLNGPLLSRRAALASDFFYRNRRLDPEVVAKAPIYVLLDRSLQDNAVVALPSGARVFANSRMSVFRLSGPAPHLALRGGAMGSFAQ